MSSVPDTNADSAEPAASETAQTEQTTGTPAPTPAGTEQGIHLTEKAAEQVRAILEKDSYPETMYLYVGVKGGGCSGLQYILDLRDETHAPIAETDESFESQGIRVVCDLKSYVVGNLTGTTIDYQDGLMGAGFTFNNPNAKHSCGCGASYSA